MKVERIKSFKRQFLRNFKNPTLRKFTLALILGFFIYFLIFLIYKDRVAGNAYLGKLSLGWQKKSQLEPIIKKTLKDYEEKNATFVFKDKVVEAKIRDLGVDFDFDATLGQFKFLGQSATPFKDLFICLISLFKTTEIRPVYNFKASRFEEFISREFSALETKEENAKFINSNGKIIVANSRNGEVVNRVSTASDLAIRLDNLSEIPIELDSVFVTPDLDATKLGVLLEQYQSLLNKKIVLNWEYDTWRLDGNDLISILKVGNNNYKDGYLYKLNSGNTLAYLTSIKLIGEADNSVEILVDDEAIGSFLAKIAKVVDRPTVNATAKFDGKRVTEFTPALDGRRLDINKTKQQIILNLNSEKKSDSKELVINLPIVTTIAKVANERINSLGIKELVGRGISYFYGSIANRIYNIELGASRVNGTLIAPGEVFSFNNSVGEVSGKTGYRQAYVISSGRTILDDGGGICQVSTTLFRAALNSGLEIVSRTAHAYRVGYYEQGGFGPGLDATVFAPSVDFKFKNDTGNYILIQAVFSRARAMLEVDIYGIRDGRVVDLERPIILSRTPAPPEIRQDDPGLPKGTVKQVDFAAEGADVYFKRRVLKNEQILHDDTFRSKFRPWQAIFLVGTGM